MGLIVAGGFANADAPLTPPQDFVLNIAGASVTGDVAANITTINPTTGPTWSIPVWARWFMLSPDRQSILVLNYNGNLLSDDDPTQIVATVWYTQGDGVESMPFTLTDTMNPADMPRSVSHFVWLETYRSTEKGWELDLSDGNSIIITYR